MTKEHNIPLIVLVSATVAWLSTKSPVPIRGPPGCSRVIDATINEAISDSEFEFHCCGRPGTARKPLRPG